MSFNRLWQVTIGHIAHAVVVLKIGIAIQEKWHILHSVYKNRKEVNAYEYNRRNIKE